MFFFALLSLLYTSCNGELFYSQLKERVDSYVPDDGGSPNIIYDDIYANCAGLYYNSGSGTLEVCVSVSEPVVYVNQTTTVAPQAYTTGLNSANFIVEESIDGGSYQSISSGAISLSTVGSSKQIGFFILLDGSGSVSLAEFDGLSMAVQNSFFYLILPPAIPDRRQIFLVTSGMSMILLILPMEIRQMSFKY